MTRLSNSLALDPKTKVKPLIAVSSRVAALFTLYILWAAWTCLIMNVKLKVSSSSFDKRSRKDGGPPARPDSGSYGSISIGTT